MVLILLLFSMGSGLARADVPVLEVKNGAGNSPERAELFEMAEKFLSQVIARSNELTATAFRLAKLKRATCSRLSSDERAALNIIIANATERLTMSSIVASAIVGEECR